MLSSGASASELDDHFRLAESTAIENLHHFFKAVIELYEQEALRQPNADDMRRLLDDHYSAGWPGCLGSIDCMHVGWKNCPAGWEGMFTGK